MSPAPGPNISEQALADALRAALPAEHRPRAAELAALIATQLGRADGTGAPDEPGAPLADALRAMAGRELRAGDALLSFGGAQTGDVTISGDIAGGDLISISLPMPKRQVISEERRYSCLGMSLAAVTSTRTIVSLTLLLGLLLSVPGRSFTPVNSGIVPTAIATIVPEATVLPATPTPAPPRPGPPLASLSELALPALAAAVAALWLAAVAGRLLLARRARSPAGPDPPPR